MKLADDFFREALVPALNRLGISPVGVFNVEIGPDSPSFYVSDPKRFARELSSPLSSVLIETPTISKPGRPS